jgi:hypothetical protein
MKRIIVSLAALFVTMAWVEAANAVVCAAGGMRGSKGRGRRSPPGGTLSLGQWRTGLPLTDLGRLDELSV